jgi:hypothetical protein
MSLIDSANHVNFLKHLHRSVHPFQWTCKRTPLSV